MRPTYKFLTEQFQLWNRRCFAGRLPPVGFRVTAARSYGGLFRVRETVRDGRGCSMPAISVSALYDRDERDVVDVLIHEMIHYYLWHLKIRDDAPHGTRFTEMMRRINSEYGRNVTVSVRTSEEVALTASGHRQYPLIVCTMSDGRRLILVPALTRFAGIVRQLRGTPAVSAIDIYVSSDSRLTRYPRVRTPKLYRISPDTLGEITAAATHAKTFVKAQV